MSHKQKYLYQPLLLALMLIVGLYLGMLIRPGANSKSGWYSTDLNDLNEGHKFNDILHLIQRDYVDPVDKSDLAEHAIQQMMDKLDPHSYYIPAREFRDVNDDLQGKFYGIGVMFRIIKDTVTVIQPVKEGPAMKTGIKAGDRIIEVEGESVCGPEMTNKAIMDKLKGQLGVEVNITVYRPRTKETLPFTIVRAGIPTFSIDAAYMIDETIGYIKLNKFSATTADEFKEALNNLLQQGMQSLIFDLRQNGGGFMRAALSICEDLLPKGSTIVYTKARDQKPYYEKSRSRGDFEKQSLIILIDEGSASASEIVAGAIQDNDRAIIMGHRSFGKGLVQEQKTFPDSSAIRLTVSRYYTPSGRSIQRPYTNGEEDYYEELYRRLSYDSLAQDSSHQFPDSLKFKTLNGRTVYGGGGIYPDVFLEFDTTKITNYYGELLRQMILVDYAFMYTEKHRDELDKHTNWQDFMKNFDISRKMEKELLAYADEQGLPHDAKQYKKSRQLILNRLKAFIARNTISEDAFYPILNQYDDWVLEAIQYIQENKAKP